MRISVLLAVFTLVPCAADSPDATAPSSAAAKPDTTTAERTRGTEGPTRAADDPESVDVSVRGYVRHADGPRDLTLRAEPSLQADAQAVMGHDREVWVVVCQDLAYDDAWCRLNYQDDSNTAHVGYAKRRHVAYQSGMGAEDEQGVRWTPEPLGGWSTASPLHFDGAVWDIQADDGYANLRSGPSSDGEVVARLTNGTDVLVGECSVAEPGQRWCQVETPAHDGPVQTGYVHQSGFHRFHRGV
ncbi:SH3 domain-containing protein [Rubrivirga sp.]|uniref:SH3 domain-containing protein n=1 Tax=Rubrivirga sp. TaxID=1885344 RepID=UPI003C70F255